VKTPHPYSAWKTPPSRLAELARQYVLEAWRCGQAKAYFASVVMMAAALDAALLAAIVKQEQAIRDRGLWPKRAKRPDELGLQQLSDVAVEMGWLHSDPKDFPLALGAAVTLLRGIRNLLHPGRIWRMALDINVEVVPEAWQASWGIVLAAFESLEEVVGDEMSLFPTELRRREEP
jgi:hypothetical protein